MKVKVDPTELLKYLNEYAERKESQIFHGIEKCCVRVQEVAFHKCPKDSEALRQSITYKVTMHGAKAAGLVGSELEYAPYVHEGTGIHSPLGRIDVPWSYQDEKGDWHTTYGIEANPFLLNARNECEPEIKRIMFDTLKG